MALQPLDPAAWSPAHARHLLNRAGFGVPQPLVELLTQLGPEAAVRHLVDYQQHPDTVMEPDYLLQPAAYLEYRRQARQSGEEERRKLQNELQRRERLALQQLKSWWIERMVETPRPLEEKLALFWHGHFASSSQKVRSSYHTYQLNKIFRGHACGNFKTLTTEVGKSFSMLTYLDNFRSTKEQPNENWARELMELFTLGQGQYTEDDIKASARAFTGWSRTWEGFQYRRNRHDDGEKTFMGRTGNFDGWQILDIIFEQQAASSFISGKLWEFFAYENPDPEIVSALGERLRGSQFELQPMLTTLFLSEEFYSPQAMASQVKSPVQFVVQLADDLGLEHHPYDAMARASASLGQDLFFPPNVKGWEGNRTWINANSLLLRYNLPQKLAQASLAGARNEAMEEMAPQGEMMRDDMEGMQAQTMQPASKQQRQARAAAIKGLEKELYTKAQEKMRALPRAQRLAMRKKFREGTRADRIALLKELGLTPLPWQQGPLELFGELDFATAGECVDALGRRFLVSPMDAEQRRVLLAALEASDAAAPMKLSDISQDKRRAVLHLITSMAEYQLC